MPGFHSQIFWIRQPSQKLSNPVPTNGFPLMDRHCFQRSVRPVNVGSPPIAVTRSLWKYATYAGTATSPRIIMCNATVVRLTILTRHARIITTPLTKHMEEVAELATDNSQTMMERTTVSAIRCRRLCASALFCQCSRNRHRNPRPSTKHTLPSVFLWSVTPRYMYSQLLLYARPISG